MKATPFGNAEIMRRNAGKYFRLAEHATDKEMRERFLSMAQAWKSLAENQAWLDGAATIRPRAA